MKLSFGIIVFNALDNLPENMLELCVKNVYDYAHEIFIVEGASQVTTPGAYVDGAGYAVSETGRSIIRKIKGNYA